MRALRTNARLTGFLLLTLVACLFVPARSAAQILGQFEYPVSVAVDSAGNVFVSENVRNCISKYDSAGHFLLRWGTQGTGDGQFKNPAGIAVDSGGNVYVADMNNARVQKFASNGGFEAKWGSYGSGPGQFRKPRAIAIGAGNSVYVLDSQSMLIQKFSSDGVTNYGSWGGTTGTSDGQFSTLAGGPSDLLIDASGFALVADSGNQRIQRWRIVSNATGAITSATFLGWSGKCMSGANCDVVNERSKGFQCTAATCSAASQGSKPGQFVNLDGLSLDAQGNLYVADSSNNRIQKFEVAGNISFWGSQGSQPGQLNLPVDVAAAPDGSVFVADFQNKRIQKFMNDGTFVATFGGEILVSASAGFPARNLDALVDPNPLFMSAGQSVTSTIRIDSVGSFQDSVTLTSNCCQDLLTGASMPGALNLQFAPNTLQVAPTGPVNSLLTITAPTPGTPGKYLVPVVAANQPLDVSTGIGLAVEVLAPIPADSTTPVCQTGAVVGSIGGGSPGTSPEVLPLVSVIGQVFTAKKASLARTSFQIAAASKFARVGWLITISKASVPLLPTESVVVLKNSTSLDKGIQTVNAANCSAPTQSLRVPPGGSGTIRINSTSTTTLLLNRQTCRFWLFFCWDSSGWDSYATFSAPPFWTLFGGRQVTIDWKFDQQKP
jgi:DNA-binding beta-propeller fold protein YncE